MKTQTATDKVFAAWKAKQPLYGIGCPVWTDGTNIVSYSTKILLATDSGIVLNTTKYSPTTTKKVNQIRHLLCADKFGYQEREL